MASMVVVFVVMPDKTFERKIFPEFFYHYTSMDAFRRLMKDESDGVNMKFHATSVYYMNDSMEFEESEKCIKSEKMWEEVVSEIQSGEPFLISFSSSPENEDSIPMWKMYGDDGYGVCIKFDAKELIQVIEKYCNQNSIHFRHNYCSSSLKYDSNEAPGDIKERVSKIRELAFYKHESWQYEKEYRLMFFDNMEKKYKNIEFKTRGHDIVPFLTIPIPISAIKKIVIGPKANFENAMRAIVLMRAQHEGLWFEIRKSDTTLK